MKLTERFQVTVSKKPKTDSTKETSEETVQVDYMQILRDNLPTIAKYAAIAYAGKKAIDTASECAIKYTPQR